MPILFGTHNATLTFECEMAITLRAGNQAAFATVRFGYCSVLLPLIPEVVLQSVASACFDFFALSRTPGASPSRNSIPAASSVA